MSAPTLSELPPPPPGKTGWPWTEEPPVPAGGAAGPWPRITLVTPTYNQGRYIEETIRSILLQGYPELEYVVFDGGSTDETVEILRRYDRWLSHWASERDRGQTHAINKGLDRATGEVFNWINSDDQLAPGALLEVGRAWARERPDVLVGRGTTVELSTGRTVHEWAARPPEEPLDFIRPHRVVMSQPSTFLSTRLVREAGGFREDLHFVMDWEFYLRIKLLRRDALRAATTGAVLSTALAHEEAKTTRSSVSFRREAEKILLDPGAGWTPEERREVDAFLRRLEDEEAITAALLGGPGGILKIARLPFRSPELLRSRFYWGGVRRALLRGLGAGGWSASRTEP